MSYLHYLCLFVHSGVKHILRCIFLRLAHTMLPVSLDCPFLIAPSVFSNVYSNYHNNVFLKQKITVYILECMNLNKVLYRLQISNVNLYNNVLYPSPERLPVDNSRLIYTFKQFIKTLPFFFSLFTFAFSNFLLSHAFINPVLLFSSILLFLC